MRAFVQMEHVPTPPPSPSQLFDGHVKLAKEMAKLHGERIFRGFTDLNILSILCYQNEILALEDEIQQLQSSTNSNDYPTYQRYLDTQNLPTSSNLAPSGAEQRDFYNASRIEELLNEVRSKLEKYYTALWHLNQISNLPPLESNNLRTLKLWLYPPQHRQPRIPSLGEQARIIWGTPRNDSRHPQDLFAPCPPPSVDPFAKWIRGTGTDLLAYYMPKWLSKHFFKNRDHEDNVYVNLSTCIIISAVVRNLTALILPLIIIATLYFLKSFWARFAVIAVFNLVFLVSWSISTNKSSDVFVAIAAFAALEVVYVGQNGCVHAT